MQSFICKRLIQPKPLRCPCWWCNLKGSRRKEQRNHTNIKVHLRMGLVILHHDSATFNKREEKVWGLFGSASVSILTFKEKSWALLEWKHFSNLLARHWDREHSKVKGMGLPVSVHRNRSQESGGLAHSSNGTVFVGECAIMEARPLIQVFHQG